MKLSQIEFRENHNGEVEVTDRLSSLFYELKETDRDFISSFIEQYEPIYPVKFANLRERYRKLKQNSWHYEFRIVRGFIKCNLGGFDSKMDIDENGEINFELIICPMAGECKEWRSTCNNKERNGVISPAELEVLKLIAKGMKTDDIAEQLFKSRYTIENQTNSMLRKTGLKNNAALVAYYYEKIKND